MYALQIQQFFKQMACRIQNKCIIKIPLKPKFEGDFFRKSLNYYLKLLQSTRQAF
jgi:hypothetical protein